MLDFIHTSDWHIYDHHPHELDGKRLEALQTNIRLMIKYAKAKMKKPRIHVAGDLFQDDNPSRRLISVFTRLVREGLDAGVVWRILVGNHDSNGIETALDIFQDIPSDDGMFIKDLTAEHVDGVQVFHLPWCPNIQEAIIAAAAHRIKGVPSVLMTHCSTSGALSDTGHKLRNMEVSPKAFNGWTYVGLGDYHKPQWVIKGQVRYCGSPIRFTWGERDQTKSFTRVGVALDGKGRPQVQTMIVKLPDTAMIQMEVPLEDVDGLIQNGIENGDGSIVHISVQVTPQSTKSATLLAQLKQSLESKGVWKAHVRWKMVGESGDEQDGGEGIDLDISQAFTAHAQRNGITEGDFITYIQEKISEAGV